VAAGWVLWADLRTDPREPDLCGSLPKGYAAQGVTPWRILFKGVHNWLPWRGTNRQRSPIYLSGLRRRRLDQG
jgi:hypothetical protein